MVYASELTVTTLFSFAFPDTVFAIAARLIASLPKLSQLLVSLHRQSTSPESPHSL